MGNNSLFQTFGCDGIPGTHKRGGMSLKLHLVYYRQRAYVVCSHQCEGLVFGEMDKAFTCTERERDLRSLLGCVIH